MRHVGGKFVEGRGKVELVNVVALKGWWRCHANARKPTPLRGMNVRQLTEISRRAVRASRNLLLISGGVVGANAKKPTPHCGVGFLIYL